VTVAGAVMPVAGKDFPGTWQALQAWFPDDVACRSYLEQLRWPDGFVCSSCGGAGAWRTGAGLFMCAACGRKSSVTVIEPGSTVRTDGGTGYPAIDTLGTSTSASQSCTPSAPPT
jgi:predicted RNA-binding Zn-ribbon protein involved in translation (DUF1610 family)